MDKIDTGNSFLVGAHGDNIMIMRPPRGGITKTEALTLAAWLVALADDDGEFPAYLRAVQET